MKVLALMALAAMSSVQAVVPRMVGDDQAAFILDMGPYLTFSRMDPIVAPGGLAGHVHMVGGASNFRNVLNTPEEQQRAKCTTMGISADKSNYWIPAVYWINKNNTYSIMSPYNRIYYLTSSINVGEVQPFPQGLRMVSGNAQARPGSSMDVLGAYSNLERGTTNKQFMMNGTVHPNAPEYLMTNIHFPACGWANQSLDSADHFSHMTWPIGQGGGETWPDAFGGQCPDTHPIRYPHLFIETILRLEDWQKEEWNKEGPNFILSNGDTTGLNWHGDFVNGWEPSVLDNAVKNCRVGDQVANCPAFDSLIQTDYQRRTCRLEGMIPNEEVGLTGAIDELPGCNPRWDWAPRGPKPTCANPKPAPGFIAPQLQLNTYSAELPLIWHGVDKTDVSKLPRPTVGNFDMWGNDQPAVWTWASHFNGSVAIDLPDVTHGNGNADDDAAGVQIAVVPGQQDASDYRDETTANPIQLTDAMNGSKQWARYNQTWYCDSDNSWYGYSPCTAPPDTADAAAPVVSPSQSTESSGSLTASGSATDTATGTSTYASITSSATTTSDPGGALVGTAGGVASGTDTAAAIDATVTGSSSSSSTHTGAAAGTPTNTDPVIADPSGSHGGAPTDPVTPTPTAARSNVGGSSPAASETTTTRRKCKPKGRKRSRVDRHHF